MENKAINLQYEHPLAPEITAFGNNTPWANPSKRGVESGISAIAINEVNEIFGTVLGINPHEIYPFGENNLLPYLAISGYISGQLALGVEQSAIEIFHSPIDSIEVHAVADLHYFNDGSVRPFSPSLPEILKNKIRSTPNLENANVDFQKDQFHISEDINFAILYWQIANKETGSIAPKEDFISAVFEFKTSIAQKGIDGVVILDASDSGGYKNIKEYAGSENWDCVIFDPAAWGHFTSLGLIAFNNDKRWKYPLPLIDARKIPHTFSLSQYITSSVALFEWQKTAQQFLDNCSQLTNFFLEELKNQIKDETTMNRFSILYGELPGIISLNINGIDPVYLADQLSSKGFLVDVGSACDASLMQPSYVLQAFGQPNQNVIRINFHRETTQENVKNFISALCESI